MFFAPGDDRPDIGLGQTFLQYGDGARQELIALHLQISQTASVCSKFQLISDNLVTPFTNRATSGPKLRSKSLTEIDLLSSKTSCSSAAAMVSGSRRRSA